MKGDHDHKEKKQQSNHANIKIKIDFEFSLTINSHVKRSLLSECMSPPMFHPMEHHQFLTSRTQ